MDRRMDGWTYVWMEGWKDRCVNERIVHGWVGGWTDECDGTGQRPAQSTWGSHLWVIIHGTLPQSHIGSKFDTPGTRLGPSGT